MLVVGGTALVHAIALAANSEYAEFWRRGPKIPAVLTAVVLAVPVFVLSVSQAVLDGERRASGPVIQRLPRFEFVIKGSNDVLTGRVVRYTGAFFVVVTADGRTVVLNASEVQMAQTRRAAASTNATPQKSATAAGWMDTRRTTAIRKCFTYRNIGSCF